ncbi:hypothetical protein ACFV0T_07865 [Streptomyces sp. NPDC059582]|uniref:hypothetical protein n=1 Tax=Streptomyces sp. NPDC059582 TaxID=3346875 RepID=UPI0036779A24
MDANPFEPSEAEEIAKHFVQVWAEAVMRQAERTRAIRKKAVLDSRNYDRNEDWSPNEHQLAANYRVWWAEEHTLVWSAYQLQQWRRRLAEERGEPAPSENQNLKLARDALEHLNEARLDEDAATPPSAKGPQGRALRDFPDKMLSLSLGGRTLFEILDPHQLDKEALKVVKSIEDELDARAQAAYEELLRDR